MPTGSKCSHASRRSARVTDGYGIRTEEVPVRADATIRFNNLSRQSAAKMVNEARRTAKEQRQSAAKGSAEEVPEEVEEAETANARLLTQIKRGGTFGRTVFPRDCQRLQPGGAGREH